jgi:hypothetical protein
MAPSPPHAFHRRCGGRVTLTQNNTTAIRNPADFNCGLVLSAESLTLDQLFEVRIDKKVSIFYKMINIKYVYVSYILCIQYVCIVLYIIMCTHTAYITYYNAP